MSKVKKITILLSFVVAFILITIPFVKVDAGGLELYTEKKCYYADDTATNTAIKNVVMTRRITGNTITTTFTGYMANGKKLYDNVEFDSDTNYRYFRASSESDKTYNLSTACPKSIEIYNANELRASSDINEYKLKLSKEENSGENIYKKVNTCIYQTYSSDSLDQSQYRLKFIANFNNKKLNSGEGIVTYSFSAEVYKPSMDSDGKITWVPQDTSDLKMSEESIIPTKCMDEVYYNPKGYIHEFSFSKKPKSWSAKETFILRQYFDFSNQIAELDKLFDEFKTKIDSSSIEKCLNKNYPYSDACMYMTLKPNCISLKTIRTYNDMLTMNFEKTIEKMEQIDLGNGLTLADNLNSSYKEIRDKYSEIVKKMNELYSQKNSLVDCILEKLLNNPNSSDEEKKEIDSLYEEIKKDREKIVELVEQKEFKFGVDNGAIDCKSLLGDILDWIEDAFFFIQIGSVLLTIVLTMLDFTKAVSSADDNVMKKAQKNVIKSVIILVAILVLPLIIEFVLSLVEIPGLGSTNPFCK